MSESLIFDFNRDVKEMSFDLLPDGEYLLSVEAAEKLTFKTGSTGYKLTLKVEDGEFAKRKVWDNLVLSAAAAWKFQSFLKAIGIEQASVTQNDLDSWFDKKHEDSVIGCELYAKVGSEESDGYKPKNIIKKYIPYETSEPDTEEGGMVDGGNEVTL